MSFDRTKPYNDLPFLPPPQEIETNQVLRSCIAATRSLAELKGLGHSLPNQSILIDSIVLQEAKSSSEIENIVTTNDALYKAASKENERVDAQTKEVLLYRKALMTGVKAIQKRPLTFNTLEEIGRTITNKKEVIRVLPGTQLANPVTQQIYYTPPNGKENIIQLLVNLEKFMHNANQFDVLVRMAVAHYQFEAIHPFYDGNGRTGRIMNILFLVENKLLEIPVLYLSHFIISHKQKYYTLLREVTEKHNWQEWILFLLEGVDTMAKSTANRIKKIQTLFEMTLESARIKLPPKVYSKELIETIFTLPYVRIGNLVENGLAKRQTASEYLKELVRVGYLDELKEGKENIYLNKKLLEILKKKWL